MWDITGKFTREHSMLGASAVSREKATDRRLVVPHGCPGRGSKHKNPNAPISGLTVPDLAEMREIFASRNVNKDRPTQLPRFVHTR
jgi:hypothetical protein